MDSSDSSYCEEINLDDCAEIEADSQQNGVEHCSERNAAQSSMAQRDEVALSTQKVDSYLRN